MKNVMQLIQNEINYESKSLEELKTLSRTASAELEESLINLRVLGEMLSAATQDNDLGYFDKNSLELFGYMLMSQSETMQALRVIVSNAEFEMKERIENGGGQ